MKWWTVSGVLALAAAPAHSQGLVELAVRSTSGQPGNGTSSHPAISSDGNVVAFLSASTNLVPNYAPGAYSVYVRDRSAGLCELAAVTFDGSPPNQASGHASLSSDGRFVAFVSLASNIVPNDANGQASDLFVRDRWTDSTALASLTYQGAQASQPVQEGMISADAQWVVFESFSGEYVPGDTNGKSDVFVRNLQTGAVERVSLRGDGSQAVLDSRNGTISADGSRVAFSSLDALLPEDTDAFEDVYVLDRTSGVLVLASPTFDAQPSTGESFRPRLASGGGVVAFEAHDSRLVPGDTNHGSDVFWFDLDLHVLGRASLRHDGGQLSDPGLNIHAFVSGDGRHVGFMSTHATVVPGVPANTRYYVRDRFADATTLVDASPDAEPGDADCAAQAAALSFDGRWVAWASASTNLVPGDLPQTDVFVRERLPASPLTYCEPKLSSQGCSAQVSWSGTPSASSMDPFLVQATGVGAKQMGLFFYGLSAHNVPWLGGRSCVADPVWRTRAVPSGGSPGGCDGLLAVDFNARIRSGLDARLAFGTVVYGQFWYRDPLDPAGHGSALSDAIQLTIGP